MMCSQNRSEAVYQNQQVTDPLILITNDNGIQSPGLFAAAQAVADMGKLLVSAPLSQQTGMPRAFPRHPGLGTIKEFELNINGKPIVGYGVDGSPAFAVAHGVLELADRKPALCISGINYGENLGQSLPRSGIVGAVLRHFPMEYRVLPSRYRLILKKSGVTIIRMRTGHTQNLFYENGSGGFCYMEYPKKPEC